MSLVYFGRIWKVMYERVSSSSGYRNAFTSTYRTSTRTSESPCLYEAGTMLLRVRYIASVAFYRTPTRRTSSFIGTARRTDGLLFQKGLWMSHKDIFLAQGEADPWPSPGNTSCRIHESFRAELRLFR